MNLKTCIVTGGAGFIGCALSSGLLERFDKVIAIDTLNPQIHPRPERPAALAAEEELIVGSICDAELWEKVLAGIDDSFTVIHLVAETGTAQSLGNSTLHTYTNVVGTSTMLDAFTRSGKMPEQILLTSSRAVYGEGAWQREDGSVFYPGQRSDKQLKAAQWDFPGAKHMPMQADKVAPMPTSVYGATKLCQENLLSAWCKAMNVPCKIVRLQNVYGPGQSLINPYTGIVSLFVRLAKEGKAIPLYEEIGMDCMSPFEVASGCDVVEIAKEHPNLRMFGGFDKRILAMGPEAIDREVDRILPYMKARGGYIPTCDHGVPEEVDFESWVHFRKRLLEFA